MIFKNISAIVFDLDNTLFQESLYYEAVLGSYLTKINFKFDTLSNVINIHDRFSNNDYLGFLLKQLGVYSDENQKDLFDMYCNFSKKIYLSSEVTKCLQNLKNSSIKLGIVTNGVVKAQKSKVQCLDLEKYIDEITYARDFGIEHEKPNITPFIDISNKIGISPSNILFVGDHPINDIEGARKAGMKTAWMKNVYFPKPDFADIIFKNFDQLIGEFDNES